MRDKERLNPFYENLREIHKEFFPDWRFGQLACNLLLWIQIAKKVDPFFIEEERMKEYIDEFVDTICPIVTLYFTFGSHEQFPYQRGEYVVARAASRKRCLAKFRKAFPDVTPGVLNCADYYTEEQFAPIRDAYYAGKEPARVL